METVYCAIGKMPGHANLGSFIYNPKITGPTAAWARIQRLLLQQSVSLAAKRLFTSRGTVVLAFTSNTAHYTAILVS